MAENLSFGKKCACKGVRSCLICEETKLTDQNKDSSRKLRRFYCIKCENSTTSETTCSTHRESLVPSGILVVENFVDQQEEGFLVSEIDKFPWKVSQSGRRKQVGHLILLSSIGLS